MIYGSGPKCQTCNILPFRYEKEDNFRFYVNWSIAVVVGSCLVFRVTEIASDHSVFVGSEPPEYGVV